MPRCDASAGLEDGPYCAAALVGLGVRLNLPMQVLLKRAFPALSILVFSLPWIAIVPAKAEESPPPGVTFNVAATPPWVKPIRPVIPIKADADDGGISYLLADQQVNVEPRASYYHEARQITSENGVQNGASISVSFDPSYQKLTFHSITLTRKGAVADRLDRSRIQLLQREKDMEAFLFDGAYTAHCQLEDVRAGDIIEFAYTVEGENPVLKGKFSRVFDLDWYSPVHRAVTRLVYPAQRKLYFLPKNRTIKPSITTEKGVTEWLWDEPNVPARKPDSGKPSDHDPCGSVQVSEYPSWEELVNWGVPLYQVDSPLSPELEAEVEKLQAIKDTEERILAALRFVQDEVRYLGIESGVGSYQPTPPSEVLRRRFGDCKDKAYLLGTLLHRAGIEAVPALVSTAYRRTVPERLPSPGAFDHVILQLQTGATTYWLDATRSGQRGPLSQVYVGDFGYALVLRPGNKSLTAFAPPPGSLPRKKIVENYTIPAPEGSGALEVSSEYHGRAAESTRSRFQDRGREKVQKEYLQYYARRFPGIRTSKPMVYEELPGANACRIKEFYVIPDIWQLNEKKTQYEVVLYPSDLDQDMGSAGSSQRDDPLALEHPVNTTQEINAQMFEDWPVKVSRQEVKNVFFRYREGGKVKGRHLQFTYSYESLADRVPVDELPKYNAALSRVSETMGYRLTYRRPVQWTKKEWRMLALVGCGSATAAFLAVCLVGGIIWVALSKRPKSSVLP